MRNDALFLPGLGAFATAFGAAALAVVALRLLLGSTRGPGLGGLAVPVGLLAGAAGLPGWPWFPPAGPMTVPWLAAAGAAVGLVLDGAAPRRRWRGLWLALFALGAVWFLRGIPVSLPGPRWLAVHVAPALAAWALVLWRLDRRDGPGTAGDAAALVTAIAAGLGGLAWLGGGPGDGRLAAALAGAGALAMVRAGLWPAAGFGAAALLGAAGAGLALAEWLAWQGRVPAVAFAVLALALFADDMAARAVPWPRLRSLATLGLALVPAVLALVVAYAAGQL